MAYYLSPIGNTQTIDANGDPLVGGTISTFLAGTSTTETTYTDDTGGTSQGVVMTLNSLGYPENGPVWMLGGVPLKFIIKNAAGVTQSTFDDVSGIGDTATTADQWILYGAAPTYISATSFSVVGDQTNTFHVGRRTKTVNSGGTVYSYISASAFAAGVTTVTVVNDSGVLDSDLSAVSYGLLTATNPSVPSTYAKSGANSDITSTSALATMTGLESIDILPGYLFGCTMSTAGSSATMSIAAGRATDSTGLRSMVLTAIAKTTSNWVVGTAAGGKSLAAAIANNTWYHFYVIRRPDTGVVDVAFSTNAAGLLSGDFVAGGGNVPDAYTQFRRIGSGRTDGSAQWTKFIQDGDLFQWDSPTLDVSATSTGTSAVTRTLTVPTGINVRAVLNVHILGGASGEGVYLSDLAVTDLAPSTTVAPLETISIGASNRSGVQATVRTNTSGQIRSRCRIGGASESLGIATVGWYDTRGRNA